VLGRPSIRFFDWEESARMRASYSSAFAQSRRSYRRFNGLVVAVFAMIAGCNSSDSLPALTVYEVKGKVLLADGKPLASGWVYLVPKGELPLTPSGRIASDGSFSVVTGGSGDGAPPGDYKIRIESPEFRPSSKTKKSPFPFKYTDEDSSGLVVTVRAEANRLEPFRLK
jgi:hypothetical protein